MASELQARVEEYGGLIARQKEVHEPKYWGHGSFIFSFPNQEIIQLRRSVEEESTEVSQLRSALQVLF